MATNGTAKGYVQKRKPRVNGWTTQKRAAFLDMLAATCNVSEAARVVGMTAGGARALRARDGEFALLWADAFVLGEERLREECIAAALGQVSTGHNPVGERVEVEPKPFDVDRAIKVLNMRNGGSSARRTRKPTLPSQHEVDAALMARFAAIDRRQAQRAIAAGPAADGEPADDAA